MQSESLVCDWKVTESFNYSLMSVQQSAKVQLVAKNRATAHWGVFCFHRQPLLNSKIFLIRFFFFQTIY